MPHLGIREAAVECDIVFLAHGRPEFTAASWAALMKNTNWSLVSRLVTYTDGDFTAMPVFDADPMPSEGVSIRDVRCGGPVHIMNHYLATGPAQVWAKIDNDVIVPPGWLDSGLEVMERHPELSFLGLEPPASRTRSPYGGKLPPAPEYVVTKAMLAMLEHGAIDYATCDAIGGVGLMRSVAWFFYERMVQHSTYGGFTDWQQCHPELVKGWIVPPLKLFLLDRLPIEPWASLSKKYESTGQQRFWTRYPMEAAPALWEWWL